MSQFDVSERLVSLTQLLRLFHLSVDESTGAILTAVVTTNDVHDGEVFEDLLDSIVDAIKEVSADGAYNQSHHYDALIERNVTAAIPPRKNAKIWQHGNCSVPPHPRYENLRAIRKQGRKKWKKQAHYHRRSLAETTMFRLKTIFGGQMRSRNFDNQAIE